MLITWTALAIAVSLTPGPDVLLVFSHATRRGQRAGLAPAAGVTAGGLWYMGLCGIGFLSLLALSPTLFTAAKLVGAIYLAWLGIKLVGGALDPQARSQQELPDLRAPFRQGLLATVLNPKVALFYLAVLPQFVGSGSDAPAMGALLIGIHYTINLPWLCFVAFGGARAGKAIRHSTAFRWIEGALGTLFIGLAARLATAHAQAT